MELQFSLFSLRAFLHHLPQLEEVLEGLAGYLPGAPQQLGGQGHRGAELHGFQAMVGLFQLASPAKDAVVLQQYRVVLLQVGNYGLGQLGTAGGMEGDYGYLAQEYDRLWYEVLVQGFARYREAGGNGRMAVHHRTDILPGVVEAQMHGRLRCGISLPPQHLSGQVHHQDLFRFHETLADHGGGDEHRILAEAGRDVAGIGRGHSPLPYPSSDLAYKVF